MTDGMVVKKRQLPPQGGETANGLVRVPPDKICTVEEYLRSIKRHKAAKESRSWDWASRVLETDNNLKVGQKIFVRYEVQHIIDDSSSTNGDEEEADDDEEDGRSSNDGREGRHQVVVGTVSGQANNEDGGVTILDTRVFWWPAIIATRGDLRCATLAEEWKKLRPLVSLSHDAVPEIDNIAKERPDIPVWELKYEAHDSFESENLPVAFLEGKKLLHLDVKHLNVGPYRTEQEVSGEEEENNGASAEDSGPEATYDLETLSSILEGSTSIKGIVDGGGGSSSSSSSSSCDEEEYDLYSSPEMVSQRLLAGAKLQEVWRKFLRTVEKNRHRLVTADMVRQFFNQELAVDDQQEEAIKADENQLSVTSNTLTESPFPRLPTNGSKLNNSHDQWDQVIEEEEDEYEEEEDEEEDQRPD